MIDIMKQTSSSRPVLALVLCLLVGVCAALPCQAVYDTGAQLVTGQAVTQEKAGKDIGKSVLGRNPEGLFFDGEAPLTGDGKGSGTADASDRAGIFPSWMTGRTGSGRGTVGVILPLSGKYESIGLKALRGIELASGVFSTGPSSTLSYAVRDYGDNEKAIPGIIESLDSAEKVVAIIGPIGENAGGIACREAQKRGIPLLAFTRAESLGSRNSCCFSNFVSVDVQADALLKAASERGITRFAVLHPTDNYGRTFTATFVQKARAYGIVVARQVEYSPDLGNFKSAAQKLFKDAAKPARSGSSAFQGLLIPDSAQNAGMIASYLPSLNVRGVRLFGPALWDSPDLPKIGGWSTEDALFVSGFYANSGQRKVQLFTENFFSTFGYKPSLWEANAYDSAGILQGLAAHEAPTRSSLKEGIGSLRDYPGLTGTTTFGENGAVNKAIYLLTVKNGTIVEVVP